MEECPTWRSGSSYFKCSSNITVSDALFNAAELTKVMNDHVDFQDIVSEDGKVISEESTVHQSVGIIRMEFRKARDYVEYHSHLQSWHYKQ